MEKKSKANKISFVCLTFALDDSLHEGLFVRDDYSIFLQSIF